MGYNDLANNQGVTFNNLQDAVDNYIFIAKTSIPSSQELITKADADQYVYINTSYPSYSAKSSNQLVVKSNLQGGIFNNRIYGIDKTGFSNFASGPVIYSENGGLSWTTIGISSATSVSRTNTGEYVLCATQSDYASVSNNFGASFTSQELPGDVYTVGGTALSNSGDYMFVIGQRITTVGSTSVPAPAICKSTNYGASWSLVYTYPRTEFQNTEGPGGYLNRIATSGNGQYVLATWGSWIKSFEATWGSAIMRSTNYGVSFSNGEYDDVYLTDVAISNTGQYQLMTRMSAYGTGNVEGKGGLYWSDNYGSGFALKLYEENYRALYCGMSASGQYMLVAYMDNTDTSNKFYFSTDYGVTWGNFNTNPILPLTGPKPGGVYVAPDGSYALIVYAQKSTSEIPWPEITYTTDFVNWYTNGIAEGYNFGGLNKSR